MGHDDDITLSLLKRAADNGYQAVMLTLDTWQLAWRHQDIGDDDVMIRNSYIRDIMTSDDVTVILMLFIAIANYGFYYGMGGELGWSDPVFRKKSGVDPEKDPKKAGQV